MYLLIILGFSSYQDVKLLLCDLEKKKHLLKVRPENIQALPGCCTLIIWPIQLNYNIIIILWRKGSSNIIEAGLSLFTFSCSVDVTNINNKINRFKNFQLC